MGACHSVQCGARMKRMIAQYMVWFAALIVDIMFNDSAVPVNLVVHLHPNCQVRVVQALT